MGVEVTTLRYLWVSLPGFELERCGYRALDPAVMVGEERGVLRVTACTPAARRLGFRRGMTAAEARACFAGVPQVLEDAQGGEQDRAALLETFRQISDRVCAYRSDALALEVSALRAHVQTEQDVLKATRALALQLGHSCRLVIADHPLAAAAMAECADRDRVIPEGEGAAWLADLPVESLHPSAPLLESWRAVGLRLIGGLASLEPSAVSGRYGREGLALWRVARGEGDPISGRTWGLGVHGPLCVSAPLEGASSFHAMDAVLSERMTLLLERLEGRGESLVSLALTLRLDRGFLPPESRGREVRMVFRVGRPTRCLSLWRSLVRHRLDRVALDAPVEGVFLEVLEKVEEPGWQLGLTSTAEMEDRFEAWVSKAQDLSEEVTWFHPVPAFSWCPEEAWATRALLEAPPGTAALRVEDPTPPLYWEKGDALVRPNRLLSRPVRLDVRVGRAGPESLFLENSWRRLCSAWGPERLAGGWWRVRGGWSREYWRVGLQGREAWIFCTLHQGWNSGEGWGEWYLHGWFD